MRYILMGMIISGSVWAESEMVWVCDEKGECQYVMVYK